MFESKADRLLTREQFLLRMLQSGGFALLILSSSLAMGAAGYHFFGELPWIDSLLNASMILAGMGPVDPMRTSAGKLFATGYALYSGVAFLSMMAVLLAPLIHRAMHRFHMEDETDKPANT